MANTFIDSDTIYKKNKKTHPYMIEIGASESPF